MFFFRKSVDVRLKYLPLILFPFSYVGSYSVYNRSAYSAYEYLSYVKVPIYFTVAAKNGWLSIPYSKRDKLEDTPDRNSKFKNVVLIVDESIRADYLSINGFHMDTTPFLDNFDDVLSLGIASSGANNSAPHHNIF